MGIDFVVRQTKAFKRSWDRGLDYLKTPDLFTQQPEEQQRTYSVTPRNDHEFKAGQQCILRVLDGQTDIQVYFEAMHIGSINSPPSRLVNAIDVHGSSVAMGTVNTVHPISGIADITVT